MVEYNGSKTLRKQVWQGVPQQSLPIWHLKVMVRGGVWVSSTLWAQVDWIEMELSARVSFMLWQFCSEAGPHGFSQGEQGRLYQR